jgi:predicted GNAT family N-acyltransferase
MYSNANKEENFEILLSLVDNESKIKIEDSFNWLAHPETLGDLALTQIYFLVQKRIKIFVYEDKCQSSNEARNVLQQKIDNTLMIFQQTNLINKLIKLLESNSDTKKDVSILILGSLSNHRAFLNLMLNKEMIQSLINHVSSFNKISKTKLCNI